MELSERIGAELATIEEETGLLRAIDVVNFARDPETALHTQFEWDDSEAAEQYRLVQARRVIRVRVSFLPRVIKQCRTYVSMDADRKCEGGGYRRTEAVLRDSASRAALLEQCIREMDRVYARYEMVAEYAGVFAMHKVIRENAKVEGEKVAAQM